MRTPLLAVALATLFVACRQAPPGRCGTHDDCPAGRECAAGVCARLVTDSQVGSRCVRNTDCVGWATCTAEVCALAPGRCDADADCATWQDCASHACTTAPGYCAAEGDCPAWRDCGADHLCALAPGACEVPADCAGWQTCGDDHLCALAPNACQDAAGCAAWQVCTSFRCAAAPGFCADASACQGWETCEQTGHTCVVASGRCGAAADCQGWQTCGADHVCAAAPGYCATSAACQPWETCDPTGHTCVVASGRCGAAADCQGWQTCGADHVCAAAPGFCATSAACQPWETCEQTGHTCVVASGRCGTTADCQGWQTCDGTHTCAVAPGRCAASGDCAAWETCGADHVCALAPGRCHEAAGCENGQVCEGHTCVADPCANLAPLCAGPTSGFSFVGDDLSVAPGAHSGTIFDTIWTVNAYGFPDPGSFSGRQAATVAVRDAAGLGWTLGFGARAPLEPGLYTMADTDPNTVVRAFAGSMSCDTPGGSFRICSIETSAKVPTNGSEAVLLGLTAVFHSTCGVGQAAPAVDGCVRFFAGSQPGQFGPPRQLEAGDEAVCATGNGTLRCWSTWQPWASLAPTPLAPDPVSAFGVGAAHACAIFTGGEVRCVGKNDTGQAGGGPSRDAVRWLRTVLASGAEAVFPGCLGTYARMADGRIVYWGSDPIAGNAASPVDLFPPDTFTDVAADWDFACGLTTIGGVKCWGGNAEGQLGVGTAYPPSSGGRTTTSTVPEDVVGLPGRVVRIATGTTTACALLESGALYCWGRNIEGQLGNGSTDLHALAPQLVAGLGSGVTDVSVAGAHACAVVNGGVQCWGRNQLGKLGDGSPDVTVARTPVQVVGFPAGSGAVEVAVSTWGSCARRIDDTVWCWGGDVVGDGVANDEPVPVLVRW